jgi:hypothetical protein
MLSITTTTTTTAHNDNVALFQSFEHSHDDHNDKHNPTASSVEISDTPMMIIITSRIH